MWLCGINRETLSWQRRSTMWIPYQKLIRRFARDLSKKNTLVYTYIYKYKYTRKPCVSQSLKLSYVTFKICISFRRNAFFSTFAPKTCILTCGHQWIWARAFCVLARCLAMVIKNPFSFSLAGALDSRFFFMCWKCELLCFVFMCWGGFRSGGVGGGWGGAIITFSPHLSCCTFRFLWQFSLLKPLVSHFACYALNILDVVLLVFFVYVNALLMVRCWLSYVYVNTLLMVRCWLSYVYVNTLLMVRCWRTLLTFLFFRQHAVDGTLLTFLC